MLRYIILKIKLLLLPDISNLATENALNAKINEVKGKLPNSTNLATNASFNAKINEVKGEISNITDLVSTTVLTAAECKISNISDLVKKKLTITQNLVKLIINIPIMNIAMSLLLLQNLIN